MSDRIDYGPLEALIGTWEGDRGVDISPEPDGTEENPYYETLSFTAIGDVENAESQLSRSFAINRSSVASRTTRSSTTRRATGHGTPETAW